MSIHMADCLQLPSFQDAEVISGERFLNHAVNNISVLEITNEEQLCYLHDSLNSFEIYLSSFSGIAGNVRAQCRVLELLSEKGNVSLVLYYIGSVIPELHPDVITTARKLELPLIIMPSGRLDLQYRDAIGEVSDLLADERNRQDEAYRELAVILSRIPVSQRSFAKLLKTISEIKNVTLLLSDISYLNTLQSSCFTSGPVDCCTIMDIFNKTCTDSEDHIIASEYEGSKINILRIKLVSHRFRYYYLYILDDSDHTTLSEGKQIAELVQLFSEIWNLDENEISDHSLIDALDEADSGKLKALSDKYNLSLDKPGTLLLLHIDFADNALYNTVRGRIRLKETIRNIAEQTKHYIFFTSYGRYFVLFMKCIQNEEENNRFIATMSELIQHGHSSITQINTSLSHIRETLQLYDCHFNDMERILPEQKIYSLSDLIFAGQCRRMSEINGPDKAILDSILKRIAALPDADDLLSTLSTFYLDTDCQVSITADHLHVHRNTVKYRLKKAHAFLQITKDYSQSRSLMKLILGYYRLLD